MTAQIKQLKIRLARLQRASLVSPDPVTQRAFLKEFQSGVQAGESMAGNPQHELLARNVMDNVVHELKELAGLMAPLAAGREMVVNETLLANKLSILCSTLFYNSGVLQGIKDAR